DEETVDDRAVTDVGKQPAQPARARAEDHLVDPVEVVLVVEQRIDRTGRTLQPSGNPRPEDVAEPGGGNAGDGEPERRRRQSMDNEGRSAVPARPQLGEHVV